LAQRQYQAVDPDNRLVAAELERRWELALRAQAEAQEAEREFQKGRDAVPVLDAALRMHLQAVGPHLPDLWTSGPVGS
jgi:hypothetical protein